MPGSIEPDVVVEQVTEEMADGEITCLYDSVNDPTFCPAQPSEPTPEEALAQLLTRGQAMTGSVQEPPSRHEDEHECSMDSDMLESMEGLSLGAVLSQRLGPPPETQPDVEHSAGEASTQQDLNKLRGPDGRSRQLNWAWQDTAEYERQKGELERMRRQGRSKSRLEAKKRAPSQSTGTSPKRRSQSRSRGLSAGENRNEPKAEPPHRADRSAKKRPLLNWIPGPEEEFPVHLAVGTKARAFILWAENYKLNPECYEVQALQFIPNHVEVTGKIVAWVMWALVYGMMGECHMVPDRIVGLEGTGPHEQSPTGAAFPTRPEEQDDLRIRARDGTEWIASWAQYWFDAQQKARRPRLFYGSDARVVSPLVYFICHHVNKVLELPVCLRHVLENSGWQQGRDHLEEHDVGTLIDSLERESVEADSVDLQNEWTSTGAEVMAWVNFDLLWGQTLEARARCDRVVCREREHKKKKA